MATKDLITCHVLDTLTGRPAPGMKVYLSKIVPNTTPNALAFSAQTNSDGRVTNWGNGTSAIPTLKETLLDLKHDGTTSVWKLKFLTAEYYGEANTFWPEVELTFFVKPGDHYHVPLLLGPYSYTTYRGS